MIRILGILKLVACVSLAFGLVPSARADAVTYIFTGGPLVIPCAGTNCSVLSGITGYITLSEPLGPNFNALVDPWQGQTASPFVLENSSFTAAVGSQFAATFAASTIWFGTAADGSINNWGIDAGAFEVCAGGGISNPVCSGSPKYGKTYQINSSEYAIGGAGTWSISPSPVPEAPSVVLFASGLAALAFVASMRQKRAGAQQPVD